MTRPVLDQSFRKKSPWNISKFKKTVN